MVSVSVLGFEKFASQVWKIGTCHEICDKKMSPYGHLAELVPQKNVTIWASRKARAPNIDATACRDWHRAETFNGLQKGLRIVYIPGFKRKWTYIVSDQEIVMKERWKNIYFLRKMKYVCSAKNEGVILDDGNFDSRRTSLHPCCTLWGRMVFVSIFSSEKTQLQMRKNWEFFQICSSSFYLPKKQSEKSSTSFSTLNVAYWIIVQITNPWTAYLFLVLRYKSSNIQ